MLVQFCSNDFPNTSYPSQVLNAYYQADEVLSPFGSNSRVNCSRIAPDSKPWIVLLPGNRSLDILDEFPYSLAVELTTYELSELHSAIEAVRVMDYPYQIKQSASQ